MVRAVFYSTMQVLDRLNLTDDGRQQHEPVRAHSIRGVR
jgi:hypothetical protein